MPTITPRPGDPTGADDSITPNSGSQNSGPSCCGSTGTAVSGATTRSGPAPASFARAASAICAQAPAGVHLEIATGLGELPFYNEDIDGEQAPPAAVRLREQVAAADRLLVVTPEYNGTMPAVLNNAIDWVSRPFGASAIKDKPLAVVGTSGGQYGGQWAHEDARKSARVAGAAVVDDVALSHAYAWGSDPLADDLAGIGGHGRHRPGCHWRRRRSRNRTAPSERRPSTA